MPVSGQSKMLDILLDTLFRNDTLKSWSIFDEKSGCITVKLRFSGQNGGQKGLNIQVSEHLPDRICTIFIISLDTNKISLPRF